MIFLIFIRDYDGRCICDYFSNYTVRYYNSPDSWDYFIAGKNISLIASISTKSWRQAGQILLKKRREYIESLHIEECLKENFCLPIDEVVTLAGVGTVVVGTVETGICCKGEQVYLEQEGEKIDITLGHIDLETLLRKPDEKAYKTEHIAVLLIGVTEEQVKVGGKVIVENAN